MTSLLGVDGNSLAHRAFHALVGEEPEGPFVTRGVLGMLASAWTEGPFDAVVVAFDGRDNRRKADFAEYKANREATDPRLRAQLDDLQGHLTDCGFVVVCEPDAEADDLLAATADACTRRGWRCSLLSSDRDLTALVGDSVTLLRPRQSMADLRRYDPPAVLAEYGVRPEQYTDLAALRGDPSDGLDGVPGVGAKTAARLLADHGTVPGIYAALPDLPPRIEAALRGARAAVERNLLLMAPIPHLRVDVEAATAGGVDLERVEAACTRLGLPGVAGRLRRAVEAPPVPEMPPPPLDQEPPPLTQEPPPWAPRPSPRGDRVGVAAAATSAVAPPLTGDQATLF